MPEICFVPQTLTNKDKDTRKLIRRHVMLGKNQGGARNFKQPTLAGCTVFRKDDSEHAVHPVQPVVPCRIGSDLSFLEFPDVVQPRMLSETLRFCASTDEKLFILEPCILFQSTDATQTCVQALACDALHLNIMAFATQIYMSQVFWQTTSRQRNSPHKATLYHYGQALHLLRLRIADSPLKNNDVSDMTIMAVIILAMHALATGEIENAQRHVVGLSKLVNLAKTEIGSLMNNTKLMIELVRCDLSVALATGRPAFFPSLFFGPFSSPPEPMGLTSATERCLSMSNSELASSWSAFHRFCAIMNQLAANQERGSAQMMLDVMVSGVYPLLNIVTTPDLTDETLRLGMMSFCAGTLLSWHQIQFPFRWLQLEQKRSISRNTRLGLCKSNPGLQLWSLMTYIIAFSPLVAELSQELEIWLIDLVDLCGVTTWDGIKDIVHKFLWIDFACDRSAQKLVEKALAKREYATKIIVSNQTRR